ncbi:MAG: glycosyltransferase family 4 protein [Xanthobacteraceae bacterium]|nr:glycosyltransferase family 4 protein [Xanthobacteraceae bacterium]
MLSDAFGGFGGIAKFNRDFLTALDSCEVVERVHALPRLISSSIEGTIPGSVAYDRRAAGGKLPFILRFASHLVRPQRANLVICAHLNLLLPAWVYARTRAARLALIVHGLEAWTPRPWVRLLASRIDTLIAVSRHTAETFATWSGIGPERTYILQNCVDLDRFIPGKRDAGLAARYRLAGSRVLLTVGRLSAEERYKGVDAVIEAMPRLLARFPDLKYLVVGDGSDRPRLAAKSAALGVADRVVFAGTVTEAEKVAHYNLADAYVMPSFGEGFGIVLIEAAACGIPVVGSRADGSREALLDGRLGQLVDPHSQDELVEAIAGVLNAGDARRRNALVRTFSVENFAARVAEWVRAQSDEIARAEMTE